MNTPQRPLLTDFHAAAHLDTWHGHGEGGTIVHVTIEWNREDIYNSTERDKAVAAWVAEKINDFLQAGDE